MSLNPTASSPKADEPAVNDAWYLHSQGRRFGPFAEHEMREYFRARMVQAGDTIAMPGQHGSVPAETAAAQLGTAPPVERPSASPASTTIIVTPVGRGSGLVAIGSLIAIIGLVYFALHEPLPPRTEAMRLMSAAATPAETEVPIAPTVEAPPHQVPMTAPMESNGEPPVAGPSSTPDAAIPSATVSDRSRSADADDWYVRATTFALAEDWSGMLAHASHWTVSEPARSVAWWYLGLANLRLGRLGEAESAFKRALEISPRHFDARWSLTSVYLRTNRSPDARVLLQELVREQPGNSSVWNDLGVAMSNSGEFDEAVAAYEKALQLEPDFRLAWVNLAKCYAQFGYLDRAKAAAAKASAL